VGSGPFASEALATGVAEEGAEEPRNDAKVLVAAEADGATAGDIEGIGDVVAGLEVELGGVWENGLDLGAELPNPAKPVNLGTEGGCIHISGYM
jgi:hypothetical protein